MRCTVRLYNSCIISKHIFVVKLNIFECDVRVVLVFLWPVPNINLKCSIKFSNIDCFYNWITQAFLYRNFFSKDLNYFWRQFGYFVNWNFLYYCVILLFSNKLCYIFVIYCEIWFYLLYWASHFQIMLPPLSVVH